MTHRFRCSFLPCLSVALLFSGCSSNDDAQDPTATLSAELTTAIAAAGPGRDAFVLPDETDLDAIPADPSNPLTAEKVALGQLLYHETGFATAPNDMARVGTYSCATCHHVEAGFKAGVPQGIADGGEGFGLIGEGRLLGAGLDGNAAADSPLRPDIQPVASPTTLNVAYQEVMLWNGQFGNAPDSAINSGVPPEILSTPGTPKAQNARGLSGVETQAIAGLGVHRMQVENASLLQTQADYMAMFASAFPASTDVLEDAAKAIAAFERTLLTNRAPFQQWLRRRRDGHERPGAARRSAVFRQGQLHCLSHRSGTELATRFQRRSGVHGRRLCRLGHH